MNKVADNAYFAGAKAGEYIKNFFTKSVSKVDDVKPTKASGSLDTHVTLTNTRLGSPLNHDTGSNWFTDDPVDLVYYPLSYFAGKTIGKQLTGFRIYDESVISKNLPVTVNKITLPESEANKYNLKKNAEIIKNDRKSWSENSPKKYSNEVLNQKEFEFFSNHGWSKDNPWVSLRMAGLFERENPNKKNEYILPDKLQEKSVTVKELNTLEDVKKYRNDLLRNGVSWEQMQNTPREGDFDEPTRKTIKENPALGELFKIFGISIPDYNPTPLPKEIRNEVKDVTTFVNKNDKLVPQKLTVTPSKNDIGSQLDFTPYNPSRAVAWINDKIPNVIHFNQLWAGWHGEENRGKGGEPMGFIEGWFKDPTVIRRRTNAVILPDDEIIDSNIVANTVGYFDKGSRQLKFVEVGKMDKSGTGFYRKGSDTLVPMREYPSGQLGLTELMSIINHESLHTLLDNLGVPMTTLDNLKRDPYGWIGLAGERDLLGNPGMESMKDKPEDQKRQRQKIESYQKEYDKMNTKQNISFEDRSGVIPLDEQLTGINDESFVGKSIWRGIPNNPVKKN